MALSLNTLRLQLNPFRFLLYAEWTMIATCFSFAIMESLEKHRLPVQHVFVLGILSVMAALLPSGGLVYQVGYVAIELALVFYGATLGYLHVLPTLYLIVLIQSCFLFQPCGRWLVAGLSFSLFLAHQVQYVQNVVQLVAPEHQHQFWMHLIAETLMFGLGLFFALKLVSTLLSERQAQEQLSIAHEQLRQYASQVEELAAVQERNRIARDIHDSLGHTLTAQNIQLQTAMKLWPRDPSAAKPFVEQAQCLAVTAMREVRRSVSTLRTDARKELPLQEAIESLVNDFRQGTGVSTSTRVNVQLPIPPQVVTVFYRVVQEALTNICKHAQATEVTVEVETMPEQIHLVITDNGQGFNPEQTNGGFGLCGMQERVAALSGSFYLHTAPGAGCQIRIEIPLQKRVAPELEQMPQFGGRDSRSPLPHLRTYARNG